MTENPGCTNEGGQVTCPPRHATRKAAPPFDSINADIVVQSSDRVDFFVHRVILSMGSAFCRIASLVQDVTPAVVQVAEDSDTLDTFLRILYPLVDPHVTSLSHLRNVLVTGIKYDAPRVVASMRKALVAPHFLAVDSIRVFAIACFCQLEEEAKLAAGRAVILDHVSRLPQPDSNHHPAASNNWFPSPAHNTYVSFFGIEPFCTGWTALPTVKSAPTSTPLPSVSSEADFVSCASDSQSPVSPEDDHRREVESSQVAVEKTDAIMDVSRVTKSNSAAQVSPYALSTTGSNGRLVVGQCAQAQASPWANLANKGLLFFYFVAVENGRKEEALACARQLVQEHSSWDLPALYVAKMETMGSLPYRRLLAYAQARCDAASADFELCDYLRGPVPRGAAATNAARDALRDRPCRTQVLPECLESQFVVSFQASVITDRPPCTQGHKSESTSSPSDGKVTVLRQCTAEDNVRWAGTVLRQYVAAVDRAIAQVDLAIA
ncbi:hypothetical protein V8D89_013040 [Ganoderma adspersum]